FTLEIIADGNRTIVKINDRVTVDYRDREARFARGAIALVPLAKASTRIEYKNIKIKELTPWIALFDGRNMSGWNEMADSPHFWTIREGLLIGQCAKGFDHLFSASDHWDNFHLVMEAKITGGEKGGTTGALGFRARSGPGRLADGYLAYVNLWSRLTTGTLFK